MCIVTKIPFNNLLRTVILNYWQYYTTINLDYDYINASWIRGFQGSKDFIATQTPLQSTIQDFWQMILENKAKLIVKISGFSYSCLQMPTRYITTSSCIIILQISTFVMFLHHFVFFFVNNGAIAQRHIRYRSKFLYPNEGRLFKTLPIWEH